MPKTICLLGSFDTKGDEYLFVKQCIESHGHRTFLVDTGILGTPAFAVDVSATEVAKSGGGSLESLANAKDRGDAQAVMAKGVAELIPALYKQNKFDAILSLGGTGGTSVTTAAMRALPMGVPKVMISTVAGGEVSAYVGISDIVMIPSIVDVAGINSISREVFAKGAAAVCAMADVSVPKGDDKPIIAATMFGNTTPAIEIAKKILEEKGYEVLVFHCTGNGGKTMESLIRTGKIKGVLDLTTTEWADELVGGVFNAGKDRLSAAAETGTPAIVTPACLDMVNWWAPDTVPKKFADRTFYPHNPNVTLMRTTTEECLQLASIFVEKLNASKGPVTVLLPLKGWSMIDSPGGKFWLPEANQAFHEFVKNNIREDIKVIEIDANVNDEPFARACAEELLKHLN